MVWPRQKDVRGENTKINDGLVTMGEKEKRTSKTNVDGRSTSSHDNKKFRTRSMEKQRGMAFGFRKTAIAVLKTGQIDSMTCYQLLEISCFVQTISARFASSEVQLMSVSFGGLLSFALQVKLK